MPTPETYLIEMTGPDAQMDGDSEPANPLKVKCEHCSLPDLDFVPQPYILTKGTSSPAETALAHVGNFLVRPKTRKILEVVVPGACTFFPTLEKKTKIVGDWALAVPKAIVEIPGLRKDQPVCSRCSEAKSGYTCDSHEELVSTWKSFDSKGVDILKSMQWLAAGDILEDFFISGNKFLKEQGEPAKTWNEYYRGTKIPPPTHPERWSRIHISRWLFFSVRLVHLLKEAKIKGQLIPSYEFSKIKPSPSDKQWIQEKLQLLSEAKHLDTVPSSKAKSSEGNDWFATYLAKNKAKMSKIPNFTDVENKHNIVLPEDYKEFVEKVGSKKYKNVADLEGATTSVLPPNKLDFQDYRKGKIADLEEEDANIDGVAFAEIDNGDCFVFDVSAPGPDYPVYWYQHELNTFEHFAANFAECIKRFVEKT